MATAHRRWMSILLSLLIALSVVLHLGQPIPPHAAMGTMAVAASSHGDAPCESDNHSTATHCGMTTACSLYAPLEASPVAFLAEKPHALPTADALRVSWAVAPQLQPPQHSPQF